MPAMTNIARYWSEDFSGKEGRILDVFGNQFESLYIGWGEPFCFGCRWLAPVDDTQHPSKSWNDAASWLERAHIVPVSFGGDNSLSNLIPLCRQCHREMDRRVFRGEIAGYRAFIEGVKQIPRIGHGTQMFTDFVFGHPHFGDAQSALEEVKTWGGTLREWFYDSYIRRILKIFYGVEARQ
jgi:hypothetical protein